MQFKKNDFSLFKQKFGYASMCLIKQIDIIYSCDGIWKMICIIPMIASEANLYFMLMQYALIYASYTAPMSCKTS